MYKAVTIWQGDTDYELELIVGEFEDISSAAIFANKQKLSYDKNQHQLIVTYKDDINKVNKSILVNSSQVIIYKIKPEAKNKWVWNADDFEQIDIAIEDFPKHGLDNNTFGSLAYSVIDESGNKIDLDKFDFPTQLEKEEESFPSLYSKKEIDYFLSKLQEFFNLYKKKSKIHE